MHLGAGSPLQNSSCTKEHTTLCALGGAAVPLVKDYAHSLNASRLI
jgi:hypothetical protein